MGFPRTVLEVRSPKHISLGRHQGVGRGAFLLEAAGENVSLPFLPSRGFQCSLAHDFLPSSKILSCVLVATGLTLEGITLFFSLTNITFATSNNLE